MASAQPYPTDVPSSRRVSRRQMVTSCTAVSMNDFRELGRLMLDISTLGMQIACDRIADKDEPVLVEFTLPGSDTNFEAIGKVARIVHGRRPTDRGYCIGIEFTFMPEEQHIELHRMLKGRPPPVPVRGLRPSELPAA